MKEISCSIVHIYGDLIEPELEKERKVVADISWNGRPARTEIRVIKPNGYYGNGITLNSDEREKLKNILIKMESQGQVEKQAPVDFDSIFASASNITDKRNKGYTTKNGLIILTRKRT